MTLVFCVFESNQQQQQQQPPINGDDYLNLNLKKKDTNFNIFFVFNRFRSKN